MESTLYNLGVVVSLSDFASKKLDEINNKWKEFKGAALEGDESVKRFDSGLKRLQTGGLLLGAGFAMKNFLQGPIDESRGFNKELALLGATANASKAEMEKFKTAALEAGLATKFSPKEAAAGLTALASAGISGADNINNALLPALDLAAASAGKLSIDDAAADMAASMMSFKRPANEVADTFVNMANVASFSIQDLGSAWRGVNLAASATNQSMATTGAVMAALKNAGATAIGSGEGVRMALSALQAPAKPAQEALQKLGVSAYDQNGKFRDLIDIFADLENATASMSEKERNAYLDKILLEGGVKAYLAVTNQGIGTVRGYTDVINQSGSASVFAKRQLDTYNGSSEILEGTMQTLKVLIGDGMTPALKAMKDAFIAILSPVAAFLKEHPTFTTMLGTFLLLATGGSMLVGSIMAINGVYKILTVTQWALNSAFFASPVTWFVAGVIALIGVVIVAVKYFDVWSSWIANLGSSIMSLYRENQMLVSGLLFLMGPVGWLIQGALVLADNWDKVTSAVRTAYDWIRKMTGTSDATLEMENSLRGLNSALDDLNAKREKAAKFGMTDDVKKYDSQIVSLEKQKSLMDSSLKQETEYRKFLKDSSDLKNSLKSEMDKGAFGKKGSAEYKSAQDQLLKLEEKSSMSKDNFLNSGISKQTEDTKKLASATDDLQKKSDKISAKKGGALDLMNANYGAVFNGGLPANSGMSGKMPDLPVSNVKLPEKSFEKMGSSMESGMKSAVETMPVSISELTSKLESVLSKSGKRLGSAFSLEFKKGIELFSFKDLELYFQKGFGILFSKLSIQAFNGGRNLVLTYNSGVGKETGGANQESAMSKFTGFVKDYFNWSDAKRGPLARTTEAGSNLIKTYSVGIVKAKGYIDKPLSDVLEQKPNKAAKNLAQNIAGESYSPKGDISANAKNTNLNIQGINIQLKDGLEGIGKILEDLIIARAEALEGV